MNKTATKYSNQHIHGKEIDRLLDSVYAREVNAAEGEELFRLWNEGGVDAIRLNRRLSTPERINPDTKKSTVYINFDWEKEPEKLKQFRQMLRNDAGEHRVIWVYYRDDVKTIKMEPYSIKLNLDVLRKIEKMFGRDKVVIK